MPPKDLKPKPKLTPEERKAALERAKKLYEGGSERDDWQKMKRREHEQWRLAKQNLEAKKLDEHKK